jgi:hypothetical protein
LRASMHIPAVPEYPSDLYRRSGNLVDLLGKLAQVVGRLVSCAGDSTVFSLLVLQPCS